MSHADTVTTFLGVYQNYILDEIGISVRKYWTAFPPLNSQNDGIVQVVSNASK